MTESELQSLLRRAGWRSRLASALSWALYSFLVSLLLAAAVVFEIRWTGREFVSIPVLTIAPLLITTVSGLLATVLVRPSLSRIAVQLDRRARIQDHVTTWLYLRDLGDKKMTETQLGFRDAQRQSALQAACSIRLKTHAPISLPPWSRAIWWAPIILLSAILIPPSETAPQITHERSAGIDIAAAGGGGGRSGKSSASDALRETPRVQVLSPADRMKFELIANEPVSEEMKRQALQELTNAIGNIPESELTAAERQILDRLRKDLGQTSPAKASDGSVVANASKKEEPTPVQIQLGKAAEFEAFTEQEKAWSSPESNFSDVRDRLDKYYKASEKK